MATDANQDLDRLLCNPQFVDDPYLIYHRLREEAPVFWSSGWNAWVLTRYADVVATLRDSAHFSNAGRMPLLTSGLSDQTQAQMGLLQHHFAQGLIHTDPPNHTRLRGLVNTAFTPRVVEQIRPQVEALVNNLLDAVQHSGRMEIIRDLAYPVPAVVVAMMLGVPAEDRDLFKHWSDEIITLQESDRLTPEIVRRCRSSIEEMKAYFGDLLLFRRSHPMDDLLGNLAAVEVQGQVLNSDELLATCVTLLIAGHETTTSLIASGLLTLLQHPDQMERLQRNPNLIGSAIEEMLRFESPIQRDFRRVADDIELDGQVLRSGALVFQMLGAANRDPALFPDPDQFDIARAKNRHLAFGYGIHFCLGAPLARLEGPLAIMAVLQRMPGLELDADVISWQERRSFRCPTAVPVRF